MEATHAARALTALGYARSELEEAMKVKPTNNAAYSRWIKAHEHMLAAATLLNLDGAEEFRMADWRITEISRGCSEHDGDICTLLTNNHDGRRLHWPGVIEEVTP
jgi:hypothetical protein